MDQADPFQRSTRVRASGARESLPGLNEPTARQLVVDEHDTDFERALPAQARARHCRPRAPIPLLDQRMTDGVATQVDAAGRADRGAPARRGARHRAENSLTAEIGAAAGKRGPLVPIPHLGQRLDLRVVRVAHRAEGPHRHAERRRRARHGLQVALIAVARGGAGDHRPSRPGEDLDQGLVQGVVTVPGGAVATHRDAPLRRGAGDRVEPAVDPPAHAASNRPCAAVPRFHEGGGQPCGGRRPHRDARQSRGARH